MICKATINKILKWTEDKRITVILFLILSAFGFFAYNLIFHKSALVKIDVQSNVSTDFKIYWANNAEGYDEGRSSFVHINHIQRRYQFPLTDLGQINKIRIDPSNSHPQIAKIVIRSISIFQSDYEPIRFAGENDFKLLNPLSGIRELRTDRNGVLVAASDNDPQLEALIQPVQRRSLWVDIFRILTIALALTVCFHWIRTVDDKLNYVGWLLAFSAALIVIMAFFSKVNVHPDEYVHLDAAAFYEDHWLPPKVCAPGTENTYSVYGVSRLNSQEIVYFAAGKFSRIISFLPIDLYLRLRLFNITLFLIICFLCFRISDYRTACAPLLISSQIWYIFSYFNSDAFSLFIIIVVGYQFLMPKSRFNRFLHENWEKRSAFSEIGFGLLFSILLFLKTNFYIFILFIILYLIWRFHFEKGSLSLSRNLIQKLSIIVLVMAIPFTAYYIVDASINGMNKKNAILDCREKLASHIYKPSTELHAKHPWMMLKKRGVSLVEMFTRYRWGSRSFKSSFGVYEYTTISASETYYTLVKTVTICFLIFICFSILIRPNLKDISLFLIVLACGTLLLGGALWRSWTVMLQPQGRYFLPIAVMFGFLFERARLKFYRPLFNAFIIFLFLISTYSFIFVGLFNIPKV